jgi:predicted nucleotidyltransferase
MVVAPDQALEAFARAQPDVTAAWVFGSRASTGGTRLSDLDVAFLLDAPEGNVFDRRLTLRADLAAALRANELDVVVLNEAPVGLRHAVTKKGRLVFSRDDRARRRFEVDTWIRYLDMEPFRRTLAEGLRHRIEEGRFGR